MHTRHGYGTSTPHYSTQQEGTGTRGPVGRHFLYLALRIAMGHRALDPTGSCPSAVQAAAQPVGGG
ncbi:hypothetical protein TSMEX_011666, partial [Taenia solium]